MDTPRAVEVGNDRADLPGGGPGGRGIAPVENDFDRRGFLPRVRRWSKSEGMVMATVALPASIMAAIWAGVSSVAARRNTPVPSIRASKAVEVALRLSSTTT
jgi:hypothetical protein